MLILIALIIGAVAGIAIHYAAPHRESRGVVLVPAIGAATAGIVWTLLTWAGLAEDNLLIWGASILIPTGVAWLATVLITRTRVAHDRRERTRLRLS